MSVMWIVGKIDPNNPPNNVGPTPWEFCGVFDQRELAEAACKTDDYFIGPVELNLDVGDDSVPWPQSWYPKLQERPA